VIHFSSAQGRGTTFQILLPSAPEPSKQEHRYPPAAAPTRYEVGPRTVLLVEDEEMLRTSVAKMLHSRGFSVIQAADGSTALDLIRAQEGLDAILLDMTIPGASSREVIMEAGRVRPGMKIILTSAYSRDMVTRDVDPAQIRGFIRKPFLLSDLVQLLSDTLA
jgi:CheY-like chemotaxis protein